MKIIITTFLLGLSSISIGQLPTQKIPRDSVRYYQKELSKLWKSNYDSLKNSDRFKELTGKLNRKGGQKVMTIELLANVGLYFTDFTNLNTRLKSIGQEEVKTMVPSVGASMAFGLPIMTYGFELNSYTFDNPSASFKGYHVRVFLATNIFKKSRIVLNPQIGYTSSSLNMFIHKSPTVVNFNDLFLSQSNTIQLNHTTDYLDFALGLKFGSPKSENFYWQFLKVGYRMGLKDAAWKMRGGDIINAPLDKNNQFYMQLCLGFDR
jgi:hypothetical protein